MKLAAIAAVAENYVIGRDGALPWRLPADLLWFVRHTRGKPIVSGRRTYESTGYLRGRTNIVVTRQLDWASDCDHVVHTIDEAIAAAGDADEVMVLGGAAIYTELMPRLDRLYLTVVHAEPEGDTLFPTLDAAQWDVTFEEFRPADEANPLDITFFILDRIHYREVAHRSEHLPECFTL